MIISPKNINRLSIVDKINIILMNLAQINIEIKYCSVYDLCVPRVGQVNM